MDDVFLSYLMGASQITDEELSELAIEVEHVEDSQSRKLKIPGEAISEYEQLIREKIDPGFWNEYISPSKIFFIFKHKDGRVEESDYSEERKEELARLCSEFNGDPIEKTRNLLDYLAGNEFYSELIERFEQA